MADPPVLIQTDARGRATVTLNRPQVHNAFDDHLIARLAAGFEALDADDGVRTVVLAANGKTFSAGADLNWMQRMADFSAAENEADAMALARMLRTLSRLSKPTVAAVQGAAYGGGVGLVAACDIAIAAQGAVFAVTEVKLGLIPAVISPYVIAAIGERQARRYMLTGERFDADEAGRIGLVHQVVAADELKSATDAVVDTLARNGPAAVAEAKDLIAAVVNRPIDDALMADTAARIARVRASGEGREGVAAFLGKRKPGWIKD